MRLLAIVVLLFLGAFGVSSQEIVRSPKPASMPAVLAAAGQAFEAKDYAKALRLLQQASQIARNELERAVLAAMPPPPPGFTVRQRRPNHAAATGLVAALQVPIEWACHRKGSQAALTITVHRAGSLVKVVQMGIAMAERDPEVDKVVYDGAVAALRRSAGGRLELQLIVGDAVVIAAARELGVELLLKAVDQSFVDRLGKVLSAG